MKRVVSSSLMAFAVVAQTAPQTAPAPDAWAGWRFLIGEWKGEGSGTPGAGGGGFSLRPELDGRVLVRRNQSDYPAAEGRPALHHEDLMVIAIEGGSPKATYWDNEGHVIRYAVAFRADGALVLTSDSQPFTPRFRLTYVAAASDVVDISFEMSTPGKEATWKTYLSGKAKRVKP